MSQKKKAAKQIFKTNVEKDPDITKYLSAEEISDCFDYKFFLRNVDMIFERFGL